MQVASYLPFILDTGNCLLFQYALYWLDQDKADPQVPVKCKPAEVKNNTLMLQWKKITGTDYHWVVSKACSSGRHIAWRSSLVTFFLCGYYRGTPLQFTKWLLSENYVCWMFCDPENKYSISFLFFLKTEKLKRYLSSASLLSRTSLEASVILTKLA